MKSNTQYKQTEIGEIPEDWSTFSLEEVTTYINRGIAPKYSENEDAVVVFNQRCIRDGVLSLESARKSDPKVKKISDEKYLKYLDILINSTGVGTLGRVAQNKFENIKATVDSHVTIVRPISEKIDPKFLFYLLRQSEPVIETMGIGSTGQKELNRDAIKNITIPTPKLEKQQQISSILSSLDDKIELNRRMNKTLEDMGKTLFKRWFVDFEFPSENGKPYKSSGGEMVNSELGEIPQGWRIKDLGEIFEINTKSISPSKHSDQVFWHFSIPSYDQYGSPTIEAGKTIKSNKTQIKDRSILVSKLNPKQEVRIWSVYADSWGGNAISSTEFINFVPDGKDWAFANFLFRNVDFYNRFADMSTGSTGSRQRVRPTEAKNLNFVYPSEHAKLLFNSVIEPVLVEIDKNVRETMELIELRDSLLPRLMNGKLRVN